MIVEPEITLEDDRLTIRVGRHSVVSTLEPGTIRVATKMLIETLAGISEGAIMAAVIDHLLEQGLLKE